MNFLNFFTLKFLFKILRNERNVTKFWVYFCNKIAYHTQKNFLGDETNSFTIMALV